MFLWLTAAFLCSPTTLTSDPSHQQGFILHSPAAQWSDTNNHVQSPFFPQLQQFIFTTVTCIQCLSRYHAIGWKVSYGIRTFFRWCSWFLWNKTNRQKIIASALVVTIQWRSCFFCIDAVLILVCYLWHKLLFLCNTVQTRPAKGSWPQHKLQSSSYITVSCNIAIEWADECRHPENWTIHQPQPTSSALTQRMNTPNINHMLHSKTTITETRNDSYTSAIFRRAPAFPSLLLSVSGARGKSKNKTYCVWM